MQVLRVRGAAPAALAALLVWAAAGGAQAQPAAEAVECDPEMARLAAQAAAPAGQEDADGVVVLDRSTVRVEDSGQAHVVRRRLQKALTEEGASRLAVQRFDYDPATSLTEVRRVVVHHADGSCSPVPLDGLLDLPQPAWSIYWGLRMKLLAVPRPAVGEPSGALGGFSLAAGYSSRCGLLPALASQQGQLGRADGAQGHASL